MLNYIKIALKKSITLLSDFYFIKYCILIFNTYGNNNVVKIKSNNNNYYFINKNKITDFRIKTFLTKEPETIKWINGFDQKSHFWDIGANIGLYSIYAAKVKNCNVISFEPSFNNLEILSKNIILNDLTDLITIAPIALSDKTKIEYLHSNSLLEGSAHSTFDLEIDQKGKKIATLFKYKTLGFNSFDFLNYFKILPPEYMKIDVDGIEHIILKGSVDILKNIKEILIEVNTDYKEQNNLIKLILEKNKFKLTNNYFNKEIKQSNQIWKKI